MGDIGYFSAAEFPLSERVGFSIPLFFSCLTPCFGLRWLVELGGDGWFGLLLKSASSALGLG